MGCAGDHVGTGGTADRSPAWETASRSPDALPCLGSAVPQAAILPVGHPSSGFPFSFPLMTLNSTFDEAFDEIVNEFPFVLGKRVAPPVCMHRALIMEA